MKNRWLVGLWLTVLAVCLVSGEIAYADSVVSIDAYWELIEEVRGEIADGGAVSAEFGEIEQVVLDNGETVGLDNDWLDGMLSDEDIETGVKLSLLDSLLETKDQLPDVGSDSAEADLQSILSRGEFDYEPREETWRERLRRQFFEFIDQLITAGANAPSIFGWSMAALALLLIVGLFFYWLDGTRTQFVAERALAVKTDEASGLTAEEALGEARRFRNANDLRTAVRYLYLSALLALDEKGALEYDRAKTNREYVTGLRRSGSPIEFTNTLRDVIDVFDRVWYGFQPITQSEFDVYSQRVDNLRGIG